MADEWTALEEAAKRADEAMPSPWEKDTCSIIARCYGDATGARRHVDGGHYGIICEAGDLGYPESFDLIAACDPQTILRLIAAARAGDAARERVIEECAKVAETAQPALLEDATPFSGLEAIAFRMGRRSAADAIRALKQ